MSVQPAIDANTATTVVSKTIIAFAGMHVANAPKMHTIVSQTDKSLRVVLSYAEVARHRYGLQLRACVFRSYARATGSTLIERNVCHARRLL